MKKTVCLLLAALLLAGCAANVPAERDPAESYTVPDQFFGTMDQDASLPVEYVSRFEKEVVISLTEDGITVDGGGETETVFTSRDILYYENRETYESGNPYGDGDSADMHTAEEASAHTVVNITAPGAYRVTGTLTAGQIRVDLGQDARENHEAVVELILEDADITCTVAPAILFLNTYECDGSWSVDTATPDVDTSAAGANLILEGSNTVSGAYVAKIYKDQEGEKKLWKQDGAIYAYQSLNVFGPGSLDLTASNEGLDSELHLTINGGNIAIRSDNDGINTNEDGVSVTTINGGNLHIIAGLGEEGDGIDSNGYLVINGGTVVASANPAADAGLDSDMGSYVNGGIVVAMGSAMDWAETDSAQVTLNLQFAQYQSQDCAIVVSDPEGKAIFAYDPGEDEILGRHSRRYMGMILSCPGFAQGDSYYVFTDGVLSGEESSGIYSAVAGYEKGIQMAYTGTDVMMRPGMGGFKGEPPRMPEGETMPADFDPENFTVPEGMEMPQMPEGGFKGEPPKDGFGKEMPQGEFGGFGPAEPDGERKVLFYMQDKVNFFSGLTAVQ